MRKLRGGGRGEEAKEQESGGEEREVTGWR